LFAFIVSGFLVFFFARVSSSDRFHWLAPFPPGCLLSWRRPLCIPPLTIEYLWDKFFTPEICAEPIRLFLFPLTRSFFSIRLFNALQPPIGKVAMLGFGVVLFCPRWGFFFVKAGNSIPSFTTVPSPTPCSF